VCVIGAGPSGLAVCNALGEAGIAYECLEAGRSVGGIWDVEGGYGGGYRSLHTNTSKPKMAFSDFPFPESDPQFPHHSDMLSYFNAYADHFDLRKSIRLGCRVESANPLDDGRWRVAQVGGDAREYAACIVATGQYESQRWPEPAPSGKFAGEIIHASDYLDPKTPVECRGKRVVVMGLGSSAAEIATELAGGADGEAIAAKVMLSARSGRYIMPKLYKGKPLDMNAPHPSLDLPAAMRLIPEKARLRLSQIAIGKVFKSVEREIGAPSTWNLPTPSFPAWGDRPTLSHGFIPALEAGRIQPVPGIAGYAGTTVAFTDGSAAEADVVIYATGYQLRFPFLKTSMLGCEPIDLSLYRRIAHPTRENLYFIGFTKVLCSLWPLSEQQAKWLAGVLGGTVTLPSQAEQQRRSIEVGRALPVFCNWDVLDLRSDQP
jgi:cation diffusion facilitator CzcD-associated flavoprotein CzcO